MASEKLSGREQEKADILGAAIAGKITNSQAAKQLEISVRQVQRAKAGIRKDGIGTVVHKLKGRPSNHRYDEEEKTNVLRIIKQHYRDFKPGFATEKLQETQNIPMTSQTVRVWMREAGLWKSRKQKKTIYRSWRPRKEFFGELQQFDGSYHYWFEDRFFNSEGNPIEVCLLASIDDATGEIIKATFSAHEGVVPVFIFWKAYVEEMGKPVAIYLDKFSTYKINHKAAIDNSELITQFERATRTLGIQLIFANSPQAKGRVERLFQTLQDRLVKDMRLAEIQTPEQGNIFLREIFIPKFNKRFAVIATKDGDIHKPLLKEETENLQHIFSIHTTRRINLDFTIQFKKIWYQLTEIQPTTIRAKEQVVVATWIDGSVHIMCKGHELAFIMLPQKPKKQIQQPIILTNLKLNYKPPVNHPWRQYAKKT